MAVTVRVRRVANPHRKYHRRRPTAKRRTGRNPGHRRRLTAKQIKFFGTRRQKAGLKAARRRARAGHRPRTKPRASRPRTRAANPRRRPVVKVKIRRRKHVAQRRKNVTRRRRSTRNPALIVTLGAVNPQKKRRVKVAHRKVKHHRTYHHRKRANPSRRRRRRNSTRVVVVAPRSRRNRRYSRRRRNPEVFGARAGSLASVKMIAGGLVGMAATKFLPTLVPVGITGSSNIVRVVLSAAAAYVASMIAGKVPGVDKQTANAVFFGGLIQTGSVALNAFLPSIGKQFGLAGMGELTPGNFLVPQNPLRRVIAPATAGRVNMSGIDRAFGRAF